MRRRTGRGHYPKLPAEHAGLVPTTVRELIERQLRCLVLDALLAAQQGVRHLSLGLNNNLHLRQDVAGVGVLTASGQTIGALSNMTGATIAGGAGGQVSVLSVGPGGAGVSNGGTITSLTNLGTSPAARPASVPSWWRSSSGRARGSASLTSSRRRRPSWPAGSPPNWAPPSGTTNATSATCRGYAPRSAPARQHWARLKCSSTTQPTTSAVRLTS